MGDLLVSAGGYTRYPKDVVKHYPDVFGGAEQGYTNYTFALDVVHPGSQWTRLPDMPGPPRETGVAAVVGDALYVFGGFSHSEPYAFRDGFRLERRGNQWTWQTLPVSLPWPVSEAGIAVIGSRIFVLGGADFYPKDGEKPDFFSDASRDGHPVGTSLLMLDTNAMAAGWQLLPALPGTSRFDNSLVAVDGKLYSLTGIHRGHDIQPMAYRSVTDAWVYDLATRRWSRLPDAPDGANRGAVAWKHFVILAGGFRYGERVSPGTRVVSYSDTERKLEHKKRYASFVQQDVLVFDARHQRWGRADSLLESASLPMMDISGNRIFALGGEGGRLWHSDTLQIGVISTAPEASAPRPHKRRPE